MRKLLTATAGTEMKVAEDVLDYRGIGKLNENAEKFESSGPD